MAKKSSRVDAPVADADDPTTKALHKVCHKILAAVKEHSLGMHCSTFSTVAAMADAILRDVRFDARLDCADRLAGKLIKQGGSETAQRLGNELLEIVDKELNHRV